MLLARRPGPSAIAAIIVLVFLAIAPPVAFWTGHDFYLDLASRLIILAIAAVSLNLILGYGGMISFGHAAYIGIGAYSVGIPAYYEIYSAWVHIPLAIGLSALFAALTGAVSLRTRGVHFIMITMAFAQMVFFALVSMDEYGGDDGLVIEIRSEVPGLDMENNLVLYTVAYLSLLVCLYIVHRMVNSRFGMVLKGSMQNETRMRALGCNCYIYRLTAYIISGAMCGYAGALLGNFSSFISPEMMDWTRSGELLFMIILGGAGSLFGPILGTTAFLVLEELLSGLTIYWHLIFGAILILTVLFVSGGLTGYLERFRGKTK
jgi:branched-chain amino acid transport system permease protein